MTQRSWTMPAGLVISLAVLLIPSVAIAAGPNPYPCTREGPEVVLRQADLPSGLLTALQFNMTDPGQRFDAADVPSFPRLPNHRLICAYPDAGGYVVEFEFGGIVHNRRRMSFQRVGDAWESK